MDFKSINEVGRDIDDLIFDRPEVLVQVQYQNTGFQLYSVTTGTPKTNA